jgi:exoribonuclease-2
MERYWTLKYLEQNGITDLTATLIKDNLVRADSLPLVLPVLGAEGLPRGAHVRVHLGKVDEISLDVSGTVTERLDGPVDDVGDSSDESGEDEESLGTSLALAINLDEADVDAAPPAAEPVAAAGD